MERPASPTNSLQPRASPASTETRALTAAGQHGFAVGGVLLVEPLHARHGHHAGGDAFGLERFAGVHGQLDLGAGADQDDLGVGGLAVLGGLGQDVAALGDAGGGAERVAVGVAFAAGVGGDVLAGQHDAGRVLVVLEHGLPGRGDLVGVAGADNVQARDGAQGGELLHRLVGRAVFAEADRVVRPDVQGRDAHQRAEADRRALVVGEDQEGAGERAGAAVQGDAVHDRRGGVLADAEVQHPAVGVALPGIGRAGRRDERRANPRWWCCWTRRGRPSRPTAPA